MIVIESNIEALKKSVFEFFRMKFRDNYKNLNMQINIFNKENRISLKLMENEKNINKNFKLESNSKPHFIINRFLYDLYKNRDGFDKSYGILTGVRPLKLVSHIFDNNTLTDATEILYNDYRIEKYDTDFLYKIYLNQKNIRTNSGLDNYNVYVHIPFCPSRCIYCSFDTTVKNSYKIDKYTKRICSDIDNYVLNFSNKPNSIYIGGGTPTSIGIENLEKIINSIINKFGHAKEFTVECGRLDTLSIEILKMLKEKNVNRISLNPQTFNENVLSKLNRTSNKDMKYWYEISKKLGFDSINMDLIMGLPGENKESILNSIKKAINFSPDNITIHTLALKNGSKLFENHYLNNSNYSGLVKSSKDLLLENGYEPYYLYRQKKSVISSENIGYSKNEKSCKYNIVMMDELENIIGFGLGASTKILNSKGRFTRNLNSKNLEDFMK